MSTPSGDQVLNEWQAKTMPRVQYIRNAYFAAAVLDDLTRESQDTAAEWDVRQRVSNEVLAAQAHTEYVAAKAVADSYEQAQQQVTVLMDQVRAALEKFQAERITLSALATSLNIAELSTQVLQGLYETIGPDSSVDQALRTARQAIGDLDATARAREELRAFLSDGDLE